MAEMADGYSGGLTPEMREDIKRLLRTGGDGLSTGAVFCLHEKGLRIEEIAAKRNVSVAETKKWLACVDHLLTGTMPSKSLAQKNSYGYRYLLWCNPEPNLMSYAKAWLRALKEIDPKVSFEPMPPRDYQYGKGGPPRREESMGDSCPDCRLVHAGECW
jgi:hypothetical protein